MLQLNAHHNFEYFAFVVVVVLLHKDTHAKTPLRVIFVLYYLRGIATHKHSENNNIKRKKMTSLLKKKKNEKLYAKASIILKS